MSMSGESGGGQAPTALLEPSSSGVPSSIEPEFAEIVIRPRSGWIAIDWRELYAARELLFFLVWRDVKIRYKQTVLGAAWAVLQPLTTMIIFSVIFGRLAGIRSEDVPYPLFVFAGLMPWIFFSGGVTLAGQSLINQQQMLTKIYFPRLFIPTAIVGALLIDLLISLGIYACLLAGYRVVPSWQVVLLPLIIFWTVVATLGFSYSLAALTVLYRDFRYVIPFLVQILMYASPVIYPATLLPRRLQGIFALNPMFGIIEAYRSTILGTPWDRNGVAISALSTLALFVFGLYYFRKTERRFADIA
jgi:lipopolysaccharide transport system permease protein